MSDRPDYFDRYETMAFERTGNGILTVRLHSDGGPVVYRAVHHHDWAHAFLDIAADRANRVIILTGTGDAFIDDSDWDKPIDSGEVWEQINWEARRVLNTLLDIDVPIIGAVNGPATIHAELALQLAALPTVTLRNSRVLLTQRWKRLMQENLGNGMALEGLSILHPS